VENENKMETVDLHDTTIFSTGTWEGKGSEKGGDIITEDYLDSIVDTFQKVGAKVKPRMILTHDGKKSEGITGSAAIGWLKNLRRDGNKLKADIMSVPKKISQLIDVKAFGRFSPGIWNKMNVDGQTFKNVIDHVALLGANLPANMDMDGFIDLYENKIDDDIIIYQNRVEENTMDENMVKDLEAKLKTFESKLNEYESSIDDLQKENEALKAEKADIEYKAKEEKMKTFLDGQIKDKKISPAQAEGYFKLAMGENAEDKGEVKEFSSRFDIVKDIIDSKADFKMFGQDSSAENDQVAADERPEDEILYDKAVEYMKSNNIEDNAENYKEALVIVSMEDK
jgi:hypothetical protein